MMMINVRPKKLTFRRLSLPNNKEMCDRATGREYKMVEIEQVPSSIIPEL